ncbi:Snf7 family protein [Mitosporidium daphniae]|uniref:Snf7 family protein n=1 Tax=Mitosporidium daphniae TaxID=1485682 RepID=A0A098VQR5_9MICR|nr:Snf7 family protein [Mitosporidium daphniae]KGG51300.1 Snf7 family protein [Mitosporidium daphniae]|eukprot:XP_013237727.1 Snf7 family protein [Mitosporidium daphniae]
MFLFGSRKSPQELLKENQRTINRAIREIDRERLSLETQEKNYLVTAKRAATSGHISSVKIIAKDAIRAIKAVNKKTDLDGLSKILQDFEQQNSIMGVKEDALDSTLDSMVMEQMIDVISAEENGEAAADELTRKILEEAGVTADAPVVAIDPFL